MPCCRSGSSRGSLCLFISTNKVFGSSRRPQSRHVGCRWTRRCQLRCLSDSLLKQFLSGTWSKALGQRGGAAQSIPISPDSLHALGVREGFCGVKKGVQRIQRRSSWWERRLNILDDALQRRRIQEVAPGPVPQRPKPAVSAQHAQARRPQKCRF